MQENLQALLKHIPKVTENGQFLMLTRYIDYKIIWYPRLFCRDIH